MIGFAAGVVVVVAACGWLALRPRRPRGAPRPDQMMLMAVQAQVKVDSPVYVEGPVINLPVVNVTVVTCQAADRGAACDHAHADAAVNQIRSQVTRQAITDGREHPSPALDMEAERLGVQYGAESAKVER